MRIGCCISIEDEHTSCCQIRVNNRPITLLASTLQLAVAATSLFQHAFSIYYYRHVFLCRSVIDEENATWKERFLSYDVIIFDFGLMRRILGTEECVANYLDGGYMRCLWCMQHVAALALALLTLLHCHGRLWLLWPALLMQSSYALGLSVLTMATAPKLLDALSGVVEMKLGISACLFVTGLSANWLFTFVLWHHFWHLERVKAESTDEAIAFS